MSEPILFGYIRVSSLDQNEARQMEKMRELGVSERYIFLDKQSGKNFDRPGYQAMKRMLRQGDILFIDSLDRLGRNYDSVIQEWKEITRDIEADIVVLDNQALFDSRQWRSRGDEGRLIEDLVLRVLAYVADTERQKIRRRQREGIAIAKAQGRHLGRPYKRTIHAQWEEIMRQWADGQITAVQGQKLTGFSAATFYRKARKLGLTAERAAGDNTFAESRSALDE